MSYSLKIRWKIIESIKKRKEFLIYPIHRYSCENNKEVVQQV